MAIEPERPPVRPVVLTSPDGALGATFLPRAGMIASSLTHRGEELLAQRRGLTAYLEQARTFALPLLYPWANRLLGWEYDFNGTRVDLSPDQPLIHVDGDTGWAIHGVLAACPDWRVATASEHTLFADLDFTANPDRRAAFPFPHRVAYTAELTDARLIITLTVTPTEDAPVPVSFGFHPYLRPGGNRAEWELTGPVAGLDGPMGDRHFDDGQDGVPGARFSVRSAERTLGVEFLSGFSSAQVFSPPDTDFICFEPMTAPTDALRSGRGLITVPPGEDFSASFAISVGP